MRELLKTVLVSAAALAVTLAAVLGGDTTITVPPPESVAEQFARHVAARRYDRALQHVDDRSGITLTTVRLGGEALRQRGAINDIEGEPGAIAGDRATATALVTTEQAGVVRYHFRFERRRGVWKIVEWEEGR